MRVVGSLATKLAPPFSLVLHYFVAGTVAVILSVLFLFTFRDSLGLPFNDFSYASLIHMFLLGFVMMVIFGALYQLIPVALEIPIFSFKLGYIQFYLYALGIGLFVFSMYKADYFSLLPVGAFLVYISMVLFLINFFVSLLKLERLTITAKFLISASVSLFIGISIGLFLAFNFVYSFYAGDIIPFVFAHIIFSLFGFVFMVIMGVSMVLLPMFTLAHKFDDRYIKLGYIVMNTAVFGGGFGLLLFNNVYTKLIVSVLLFVGLLLYLLQVLEIYRKRPRKTPDIGIDTMFYSHTFLLVSIVFGWLTYLDSRFSIPFAVLLVFGFLATLIFGTLYKIIPFLTWFHRFSELVGKVKVPM
ncbi:MAG: hypothetical protein GXO45_01780, partial [Aquificae bacterium]|nr:hypothetical protein [Aquificota bacterium]